MLRILTARNYEVTCEVPCPDLPRGLAGDFKRIDFVAKGHRQHFAVEVKWARHRLLNVEQDHGKLSAFVKAAPGRRSYLCVFGRKSHIENIKLSRSEFIEHGGAVYADFDITKYGCRLYYLPLQHDANLSRKRRQGKIAAPG